MEGSDFLKQKYNALHASPESVSAARRTEARTGERVSQNPADRIQNYLDRLEQLVLDPRKEQKRKNIQDGTSRPRALSLLREMVMDQYVRPHKEKLAEGAAMVEERAARQLGIDMHYGEEELAARGDIAVKDLESSLDQWIAYLSDLNEPYPTWLRYYAFRNILELGEYDKDKQEFPKRSAGTNRLFPDIDRGALAHTQEVIECAKDPAVLERVRTAQKAAGTPEDQLLTKERARAFSELSFGKQYAESVQEAGEITPEMRAETHGKWVAYGKDTDPTALWASLQNKGTAWCTKGFATAETQLKGGDFYIYYTLDKQGKSTIPRIAIRMQQDGIAEVRGVADSQQNLEGNMVEIADEQMGKLPGKEKYQKASSDMRRMTGIYQRSVMEDRKTGERTYLTPELTKDDLVFLYELNAPIEGFGYQRDPRIEELRAQRDPKKDAPIVFDCAPEQIAHTVAEIRDDTKAYLGALEPGIFDALPENIEHVYTKFPEERIKFRHIELGTGIQNGPVFQKVIEARGMQVYSYAAEMLKNHDFKVVGEHRGADLIEVSVAALGFNEYTRYDAICARAAELGLELCPAEVGPQLRLQYTDQPLGEWVIVAMKTIRDSDGNPNVFALSRNGDGLWLNANGGWPDVEWSPGNRFVFLRPRK